MLIRKLCLVGSLLVCGVATVPAQETFPARVVDSSTETVTSPADPAHCTFWDYDAYCLSSSPVTVEENLLTVEEPDGRTLQLACTVDRQHQGCERLTANEPVALTSARGGYEVKFEDARHLQRKQFYALVRQTTSPR